MIRYFAVKYQPPRVSGGCTMNKTAAMLAGLALMSLNVSLRAEPIEKAAAEANSALSKAREEIRKETADANIQPVTCQNPKKTVEIDFSGRDGISGFYGEKGEDAPEVVLILKADPSANSLEVKAYEAKEPKKAVELSLCLPLQKNLKLYAIGGRGGYGDDAVCNYRPDGSRDMVRPAGNGGDGGNGGNVTVYYSHPELLKAVSIENRGGWGGRGGNSWGCPLGNGISGLNGDSGKITHIQGEPPPVSDSK